MTRLVFPILLLCLISFGSYGHAEHDKARYVAPDGVDKGRCEKVETPCRSIGYAVMKANKGDKVLVAEGQYFIENVDELFYLTSTLVPVYGGYTRQDHYKSARPTTNLTYLLGVPSQYKTQLRQQGFTVVTDGKAIDQNKLKALKTKLAKYKQLAKPHSRITCVAGQAGDYPCNKIDLVAHVPLSSLNGAAAGNDIWGHVDLNTGDEYAIIGLRNGTAVVSLADPSTPLVIGTVAGSSTVWRDIKTYQYYDLSSGRWQAYAYVSADGAMDKVTIIDLGNLPHAIKEVGRSTGDSSIHNIYISNVNYSTGVPINGRTPLLHSLGSNVYQGAHRSYSLQDPELLVPVYVPTQADESDYTHDGTSFVVTDNRVGDDCQRAGDECDVFVDFNENSMRLWDQTDQTTLTELGEGFYNNAHYTHSGWWTEDQKYIFVHDELDEQSLDGNTAVIIFDVTDLNNPVFKGRWQGTTKAIDHNGFARGNRYYMSTYERGLTVLDISNPTTPVEIGFFDTYPIGDSNSFNGAWGVYPFLPSGLILVSDINSGLYILKDNTKAVAQGQLSFNNRFITTSEGQNVEVQVRRINGSTGAISVDYQTLWGSAKGQDFTNAKGTLSWSDGDNSTKLISIEIALDDDESELDEQFSVELFNVRGGATLYSPGMAWITISGEQTVSAVEFEHSNVSFYENNNAVNGRAQLQLNVKRFPPYDNESYASVSLHSSQASLNDDFTFETQELYWPAGDESKRTLTIEVIDDVLEEQAEAFVLQLMAGEGSRLVNNQQLTVTLLDDEANAPPSLTAQDYASDTVFAYALQQQVTVQDDDQNLTYHWQLTDGDSNAVTLTNEQTKSATVTLSAVGSYEFELTVTDPANQTASVRFSIEKLESGSATPTSQKSGGSLPTSPTLLMLAFSLLLLRRRATMNKQ